jgi:hypothetical protein
MQAIYDTPEHICWQIIHAYLVGEGDKRRFTSHDIIGDQPEVFESFRESIIAKPDKNDDYEGIGTMEI